MANSSLNPAYQNNNDVNKRNKTLVTVPGLATAGLGALALIMALATTRVTIDTIGWVFLFAGIAQFVFSVAVRNWTGFAMHLFLAITYCVAGGIALYGPIGGTPYAVTLFLSLVFMTSGILRIVISRTVVFRAWPWAFWSGVVTTAFGVYCALLPQMPGPNLIGLMVGLDLILFGAYMTAFGLSKDVTPVDTGFQAGRPAHV